MRRALLSVVLGACTSSESGPRLEPSEAGVPPEAPPAAVSETDAGSIPDAGSPEAMFCETFDDDIAAVKKRWAGVEEVDGALELVDDGVSGRALRSRVFGKDGGQSESQARLWVELPTGLSSDVEIKFAFRLARADVVGQDFLSVDMFSKTTGNVTAFVRMHLQNSFALLYFARGLAGGANDRLMADEEWHKVSPPRRCRYRPWAELLKRTFDIDVLCCPRCAGACVSSRS